jgi:hypothetical protein
MAMAPLVYSHFQAANITIPEDSRRALMALTLRHRRSNDIRYSVLADLLAALRDEDIGVLVLKGAALALTVYSRPGLRPMRDIDILVRKRDALRAQMMLVDLGFQAIVPQSVDESTTHHLPVAQREEDGLTVSVEVHFRLLPYTEHALTYEELITNATSFSVNEIAAKTLSNEDMLWHIYRHSFALPQIDQSLRLVWVADFISVVEKYVDEIDWDLVKNKYAQIWHILPTFHYLTPWSENVLKSLQMDVARPPKGVGQTFQGWPHSSLAEQRKKGTGRFLGDTFWPSEWWTWLYYGADRRSLKWWWIRLVRHPLHIGSWVLQYLRKQLSSNHSNE